MLKKLPLILFILGLSYCTWWISGVRHLERIADDKNVGKTLLIYHSAGEFVLREGWYFGKQSRDSYFSEPPSLPDADLSPKLYTVAGRYREVPYGLSDYFVDDSIDYLLEPAVEKADRRLFIHELYLTSINGCEQQIDFIDPTTGIKVDFVCQ